MMHCGKEMGATFGPKPSHNTLNVLPFPSHNSLFWRSIIFLLVKSYIKENTNRTLVAFCPGDRNDCTPKRNTPACTITARVSRQH